MTKPERLQKKIPEPVELAYLLAYWRFRDYRIVFTNGCFDLIHLGHIDYLAKAADLGDVLVVGLNTDASTRRLKGPTRPINDERARALVLASMSFVSTVVLFDEDTPLNLIKELKPQVLVKGGDWRPEQIVGSDVVLAAGGKVLSLNFVDGRSTTNIIKQIDNEKK